MKTMRTLNEKVADLIEGEVDDRVEEIIEGLEDACDRTHFTPWNTTAADRLTRKVHQFDSAVEVQSVKGGMVFICDEFTAERIVKQLLA